MGKTSRRLTVKRRPCSKCKRNRAEKFYVSARGRVCSYCRKASSRANTRNTRLIATYGITQAEYEELYEKQEGRCLICHGYRRVLDIDHDHALEKAGVPVRHTIRGLICRSCNKALANFRDNAARFRAAADYLERGVLWPAITPPSARSRGSSAS